MATDQQPAGENPRQKKQSNQKSTSESQYNPREKQDADFQDDEDGLDSDRRTGTSLAGNTANDSFNATAEKQQTDRDKNAEG